MDTSETQLLNAPSVVPVGIIGMEAALKHALLTVIQAAINALVLEILPAHHAKMMDLRIISYNLTQQLAIQLAQLDIMGELLHSLVSYAV